MKETLKAAARRLSQSAIREGFKPQAIHTYTDATGSALYWKIRLKNPKTGAKWIRPARLNGDGYELGEPNFKGLKPLYHLAEIVKRPDEPVIVCEGENKVDALAKLGLLATTSGAVDSVGRADWSPLAGRDVMIWPDFDSAGKRYGTETDKKLSALNCMVKVIDVDRLGLAQKGDAVDWIAANPRAMAADVMALPIIEAQKVEVAAVADDWTEPKPLPEGLPQVDPFDPELLPDSIRPWIADICDRLNCPLEYVAIPAMIALGSVIGRQVGIRPQARTDWTEAPNLWAMLIGRPGTLKSPAIESALAPLRRLSAQAVELFDTENEKHGIQARAAKIRADVAAKKARQAIEENENADIECTLAIDEPEPPTLQRYIANDTTAASLAELLRQNENGLLVFRDELVSLLMGLDREDMSDARGLFLSGWNGYSPYVCDRIGRGLNLHVKAVCISLLGSTQPGRISDYIRRAVQGGLGDDGLLQRFSLMVWPDNQGDWKDNDISPNGKAARTAFETFEALCRINPGSIEAQRDEPDGLPYLRLNAAALEIFVEWRTDLERRLRGDLHPALESHFSKYKKSIPALALITHLSDRGVGPVSETATAKALDWDVYLQKHAERIYFSGLNTEAQAAQTILRHVRRGKLPQQFTRRDVHQKHWSGLTDLEKVSGALDMLTEYHWLTGESVPTGGRPTIRYQVNPRVTQ
ncbi:MAG: DUF3987 domain-containing protein [Proteobacteria bacterium]|nr:DUF3987 domain-containing protein [Pseudomonadota bacterium]